jgi:hypothetical protein
MNMDNSLQSAIQKMGSNFLVAAFVPSMAFIAISSITFDFILPAPLKFLASNSAQLIQSGINLLLFTTILGFTLFSLSTYIYKAFEGYASVLGANSALRRSFLRRQKRRFKKNETERIWVEKQIARIDRKIDKEGEIQGTADWRERRQKRYLGKRNYLYDRQYSLASDRSENFPPSLDFILPTRFGNILRSAEMYPGMRYSIDAVPLWGRLIHVIPEDGMAKIDEANNQCLFLLNAALLASVFAILCLVTSVYQGIMLWAKAYNLLSVTVYIVLAILASGVAWLFYEASLLNVSQYGNMIRAAYDLYRFNLLEALHLKMPNTLKEEKVLWRRLSYFMVGNDQWEQLELQETLERSSLAPDAGFEYVHPQKQKTQVSPESLEKEVGRD